ncbi:Piso0_005782 [Millerozyma farinosa CBS 7064]|uniref:Piso0_005782 protein n=1 Tax=Pichia sorbitophila (strain ATCC MYA-4447 / BCRC 22081 / CBS 7064 / NBRC 10061 / NRRL Y-12695) TaxID=559304 RepID=G8Y2X1_PICSO|nr:Piso0_005782 [Millerozyma farinosa CBS 7064]
MRSQVNVIAFVSVLLVALAPVFAIDLLSDIIQKVESIVTSLEQTVEKTVDSGLVNKTLDDIDGLVDPVLNNLAKGLDDILNKVLGQQ